MPSRDGGFLKFDEIRLCRKNKVGAPTVPSAVIWGSNEDLQKWTNSIISFLEKI
jgi:heme-degrading monooxygenase HmoA